MTTARSLHASPLQLLHSHRPPNLTLPSNALNNCSLLHQSSSILLMTFSSLQSGCFKLQGWRRSSKDVLGTKRCILLHSSHTNCPHQRRRKNMGKYKPLAVVATFHVSIHGHLWVSTPAIRYHLPARGYLFDPASSIWLFQRLSHASRSTHSPYSESEDRSFNQLWLL